MRSRCFVPRVSVDLQPGIRVALGVLMAGLCFVPVGGGQAADAALQPVHRGSPVSATDTGVGQVESMAVVRQRDALRAVVAGTQEGTRRGAWVVPRPNATFFPFSGRHNVVNQWGDTCMGVSFPGLVHVDGVYLAGQGGEGAWTTGVRVIGFREGREVGATDWFVEVGPRPVWFEIALESVDRVVFQSIPAFQGAGWYALDDLTFTGPESAGSARLVTRIIDFEDCRFGQELSGSTYAGLVWELGMGDFGVGETIPAPRIPPDAAEEDGADSASSGTVRGGGGTAPQRVFDFQGVIRGDAGQFSAPPDTCGAVGPDHFVEVVNTVFAVYDKETGDRVFMSSLSSFLPGSSGDPRVLFDQHSGRWVVIVSDFNTRIYLAVSMNDDPTGSWFKTHFVAASEEDAGCFPDYPTLGVDENGIYTASYMVGCGMSLFAIDKAPLVAPAPSLGTITAFRGLPFEGAIQPVHTYGLPGEQYCVSRQSATQLRVRAVVGPLTAPGLEERAITPIPSHATPPDVPALGSTIPLDSVDHRLMNAVYRDGAIWTCHAIGVGGRAACRWYQLNPLDGSLLQLGTVEDPLLHYFFPSVAVNARGDVVMGFSGSEASRYAECYYTGRMATDPPGQMAAPRLLRQGDASHNIIDGFGRNRWGDYSLTTLDPRDQHSLWTIQEYAHATDIWGTWIAHLSYGDCNNNGIDDALDIQEGTSSDCNQNVLPDECEADCNSNGVADDCDLSFGTSGDCQSNGVPDECDIASDVSQDCTANAVPDECETDCNANGIRDDCDIAAGTSADCNQNAIPDDCEPDCNTNGITDSCDLAAGTSADCLPDAIPDECQPDCNTNGIADGCDIAFGTSLDCQPDAVPDECQLGVGGEGGIVYLWDDGTQENAIGLGGGGTVAWMNQFTVLPEGGIIGGIRVAWGLGADGVAATVYLWSDPNGDGNPADARVLASAPATVTAPGTGIFTEVDLADTGVGNTGTSFFAGAIITHPAGSFPTSLDQSSAPAGRSWIAGDTGGPIDPNNLGAAALPPSEVGTLGFAGNWLLRAVSGSRGADCNSNGTPDDCDIAEGVSDDCDSNGRPDECEDCNRNGLGDACDIASGTSMDCNENGLPDECDIATTIPDCDENGVPDDCQPDCNENGVADACDVAQGTSPDCDHNAVPDECDPDCNANGVADGCDVAQGTSLDCQPNGVPDECDAGGSVLLSADFESGFGAEWTASGLWHTTDACPRGGTCDGSARWAYYGRDAGCSFATGARTQGELISPTFLVPAWAISARLEFCSAYAGESGNSGIGGFDWAWVEVNGIEAYDASLRGDSLQWEQVAVDLSAYAGQRVTLSFHFDSFDGIDNAELGWQIDAVRAIVVGSDCNLNAIPDDCDIASGSSADCDLNALPDECEDCNDNGVGDACDISGGSSDDCNANALPDECDVAALDCNSDGVPDDCDIAAGTSIDCNADGTPDECDIAVTDCNANGTPDDCDVASGASVDCDRDVVPDECQLSDGDCNTNGVLDACEVAAGCEPDGFPPGEDISSQCPGVTLRAVSTGGSVHAVPSVFTSTGGQVFGDQFGFPFWDTPGLRIEFDSRPTTVSIDVVSDDVSDFGVLEAFAAGLVCDSATSVSLSTGESQTLTVQCAEGIDFVLARAVPCCSLFDNLVFNSGAADCDANGVPDECDPDCNANGTGDGCDVLGGASQDCNANQTPDECEVAVLDCNANGTPDDCDIDLSNLTYDCNANRVPDVCEMSADPAVDCDHNGILDECDAEACYPIWDGFEPVPPFAVGTAIGGIDYNADGFAWDNPSGSATIANLGCPASSGKALKTVSQQPPTTDYVASEYFRALDDGAPLQSMTFDVRSEALLNPRIDWQLTLRDATEGRIVILIHWASTQSLFPGVTSAQGGNGRGRVLVRNPSAGATFINTGFAIPANTCYRMQVTLDNLTGAVRLYINGTLRVTTTRLHPSAYRLSYYALEQKANGQASGGVNRLAFDNFELCLRGGAPAPGGLMDCNDNQVQDSCDLSSGAAGDCEGNGVPDSCEHPGDLDCDGDVDSADFSIFRSCLRSPVNCGASDLDADGDVDCADWGIMREAWTDGVPPIFQRCPQPNPYPPPPKGSLNPGPATGGSGSSS